MPEIEVLRQYQALPLEAKVNMSLARIREWYDYWHGNVYVSFSGGKDSTVLAHLVREYYPDVPLVFSNTGLEYPEIQQFARKMGAIFVRPDYRFDEIISKFGYPIIGKEVAEAIYYARRIRNGQENWGGTDQNNSPETSRNDRNPSEGRRNWRRAALTGEIHGRDAYVDRTGVDKSRFNKRKWLPICTTAQWKISHKCCVEMKKKPLKHYSSKIKGRAYVGTLTEESLLREQVWRRHGCNAFDDPYGTSQPMSFWSEQDVLTYIQDRGLEICSVYGDIVCDGCKKHCTGCDRTGCIFCLFGAHLERTDPERRLLRLAETHPKQYEYCLRGGQWVDNPDYDPTAPRMDGEWENWNPKKIWVPSKEGLGMKKVLDDFNQLYPKTPIKYK